MPSEPYLVELPATNAGPIEDRVNVLVVWAEDATDAKALAKAYRTGDSDAAWAAATVTQIAAGTNFADWRLRVVIVDPTTLAVVGDVTVTGAAAATVDTIGTAMAAALIAADIGCDNAAYDTNTNILTISSIADGLGDHIVTVEFLPPVTWGGYDVPIPSFVGDITDEGVAAAALTVVLNANDVPNIAGAYQKRAL
ncbi:hypothetical protein M0R72_08770 [Candidatus Pacearchaeota archaeon]|jgi:hypothetical protein|nr:hypothetical protein [Candidatus Pacearchaeota archaeon]